MTVEVEFFYSPYCRRCRKARERLRALAGAWSEEQLRLRERDVLEALDRAVAVGVIQTPALVIDGRLVPGPVPSRRALEKLMREHLSNADGASAHAHS